MPNVTNIFAGLDIAALVDDAFQGAGGTNTGTLQKVVPGAANLNDLGGDVSSTATAHTFRGFIDVASDDYLGDTTVATRGQVVVIFGNSIAPAAQPEVGDAITIEGETYNITQVQRDPAGATYTCGISQ